jgi:hypothetical protein
VRAAVVPLTPLLVRSESGLADPVADLRDEAVAAVRELAQGVSRLTVLCPVDIVGAPAEYWWPSGRAGSGALSEQVARHLVDLAGVEVDLDVVLVSEVGSVPAGQALLVLGDGTACRSQAAPGFIDERAFPFDDLIADALEGGDGDALARLDQDLAAELLVTGRHTFAMLGAAKLSTRSTVEAELRYRDDPFGMTYFVAIWS